MTFEELETKVRELESERDVLEERAMMLKKRTQSYGKR